MDIINRHYDTMLGSKSRTKRLGIFIFYDSDGVVDDYVCYLLDSLRPVLSNLQIICNGKITQEGLEKLEKFSKDITVRENKGFDVIAWKNAITKYNTKEYLSSYEELVLFNDTFYGPFCPFEMIFDKVDKTDIDFWGLSAHPQAMNVPNKIYGHIPAFIQSFFMVFRKKVFESKIFIDHWLKLPEELTFDDAVAIHEVVLTKKLEDAGYVWDAYVNYTKIEGKREYGICYNTFMPATGIVEYNLPFVRRKLFKMDQKEILKQCNGLELRDAVKYIENHHLYPINLMWDNVLRLYDPSQIKSSLKLNYILSSDTTTSASQSKVCIIIHLFYTDKLHEVLFYLKNIPIGVDLFITTNSNEKKTIIETFLCDNKITFVEIIVSKNRGREQSALLIECAKVIQSYDYMCFIHDKKTTASKDMTYVSGSSFQRILFENLIFDDNHIKKIIKLFDEEPRLGVLVPPNPIHSIYSQSLGAEWTINYEVCCELLNRLNVNKNIDINKPPITLGTAFWCRTKSLSKLFNYDWNYDDFPKEPVKIDGTIMHALERCFSFIAQDSGYYTGWVMNSNYASAEVENLNIISQELMKTNRSFTNVITTYDQYLNVIKSRNINIKDGRNVVKIVINKSELITRLDLFDPIWYKLMYLRNNELMEPLEHYLSCGWKEGCNPSSHFDSDMYRLMNMKNRNMCPLIHYVMTGFSKEILPVSLSDYEIVKGSLLFSVKWYLSQYKDVEKMNLDPIEHYLTYGWKEGRNPSPQFNNDAYLVDYNIKENPLVHYLKKGRHFSNKKPDPVTKDPYTIIKYSELLNEKWYRKKYTINNYDIVRHIMDNNTNPSVLFDSKKYIECYPDVQESKINPIYHYLLYGIYENRLAFSVGTYNKLVGRLL